MAKVDMRDEDGQVVDGWIVRMPDRGYLFHVDNTAADACHHAGIRYRRDGGKGAAAVQAVFKHRYAGQRHRARVDSTALDKLDMMVAIAAAARKVRP